MNPAVRTLTRGRLRHVDAAYLRPETISAANARLIQAQSEMPIVRHWGGGYVVSADGLRFVVPVKSLWAAPNPRYFGHRRGATWLNVVNDQVMGIGGLVVPGTVRDSLYILDAILGRDGGPRPEVVITDTASYSDIVFGLFAICGYQFSPGSRRSPTAARGESTRPPVTAHSTSCRATGSVLTGCGRTGRTCSGSPGR